MIYYLLALAKSLKCIYFFDRATSVITARAGQKYCFIVNL